VQSAESSNRIEGVTVEPARLRPLVLGGARPRDRSEQEVRGYRRALDLVHGKWQQLWIDASTVRRLHALAQDGSGDAGTWKASDNEIVELQPGKPPVIRFRPVSAKQTPKAMEELSLAYRAAVEQAVVPPLVAVAALILDFLCIHPFRDGNGRVSRLLTLLALYQHEHLVGRYVSTERLVEDAKAEYYEALRRSSERWHDGEHDFARGSHSSLRSCGARTWSSSSVLATFGRRAAPRHSSSKRPWLVSKAHSALPTWSAAVRG